MTSIQSKLFNVLLRLIKKKTLLKRRFKFNKIDLFTRSYPSKKLLGSITVETNQVHEHNVFTLNPGKSKQVLYLHGGAYIDGFLKPHWDFLHMLIKNTDYTIIAPDYPLAPRHTYKQSFSMVLELYKQITNKINSCNLILMGDSAGGGFAFALAQLVRDEGLPQPEKIILLSPWLDLALGNSEIKDIDPSDLFLDVEGLRLAGMSWANGTSPDYYLLSPLNGSVEGLGKISVFAGSREIFAADARKLKRIAVLKGIHINYFEYPGMFHAWMLLNLPESKDAKQKIISILKE